jgi:hypothetical protein
LAYSNDIPPDEYIEIVNQANTRRIRELISSLAAGQHGEDYEQDVRERIQQYNQGVQRIIKTEVPMKEFTLLTGIVTKAFGASWLTTLGVVLSDASAVVRRVGSIIDATKAGDALDGLRGKINRVPSESMRLYRLRNRLAQARRKA